MEKYENQGLVGEGSYGMVLKCRHKDTGQLVAIKKFLESEDDKMVKKIAMREVKMLKQLRHDHLVNLLEVFRRKKRLYLVFEFVDHTVLDELEKCPNGLDETTCRKILWQVLKGIEFCHLNNIIHRDIKPENILVSKNGVVKLCDFGFARTLAQPGEIYTDYVATRWYRAPELLVGDTKYGKAVDIWAVGCLLVEMLTGEPLFPGDSDIDQLYHIVKVFGNLTARHKEVFLRNPLFVGMRLPEVKEVTPMEKKFPRISHHSHALIKECLQLDPDVRPTCSALLKHEFFTRDGFATKFMHDLKAKISREQERNPLINTLPDKEDGEGADNAANNKTTTKKKKKIPLTKKVEDHNKSQSKTEHKITTKEETKNSSEDKSKKKLADPPDKSTKATPPNTTLNSKTQSKSSESSEKEKSDSKMEKHNDKPDKMFADIVKPEKLEKSFKQTKGDKSKGDDKTDRESVMKTDRDNKSEREKELESRLESTLDNYDRNKGADSKLDHINKEKGDINREKDSKEHVDKHSDNNKSDRHSDKHPDKHPDKHSDKHPDKQMDKHEAEKDDYKDYKDREKDKENTISHKDSPTIPPIHPSGHNIHTPLNTTPSIPSISSPNMVSTSTPPHIFVPSVNNIVSPRANYNGPIPLRVNDKMVKKQQGYKKAVPNHHSVILSPQPLQSEKSHLHDKSLEKLRTQKRESTILEVRREKEMISFPEVRGAEAAPLKVKAKQQAQRSNVATIPHITNLDPFPSSSQKTRSSEFVYRFLDQRSKTYIQPRPKQSVVEWQRNTLPPVYQNTQLWVNTA